MKILIHAVTIWLSFTPSQTDVVILGEVNGHSATAGLLHGPVNPFPFEARQPDSTSVTIRLFGDEWYHYAETIDGYTVMREVSGKAWVYAVKGASGRFVASGQLAHDENLRSLQEQQLLNEIGRHVREDQELINAAQRQNPFLMGSAGKKAPSLLQRLQSHASDGHVKLKTIVILIQFTDAAASLPTEAFHNMMNEPGWTGGIGAQGSFNDYMMETSYNQFEVIADVYGWFTSTHAQSYYANSNGHGRVQELAEEAIAAAEADGVDFSQYDNDGDGKCDGIIVVHAGPGAAQWVEHQYIWPVTNVFWNPRSYDGVRIDRFMMVEELQYDRQAGIGMYIHEAFHLWGRLPDLYDLDQSSNGLGSWSPMAFGIWTDEARTPPQLSAWGKQEMGWLVPRTVQKNGSYSFTATEFDSTAVYRLNQPWEESEYFLVENRQRQGFNRFLPGTGLLIWHIDESQVNNKIDWNRLVDLEEADGLDQLDSWRSGNTGDAGDPFPGSTGNSHFGTIGYPSSASTGSPGKPSDITITNISMSGEVMSADINVSGTASFTTNVRTGHAPLIVSFMDQSESHLGITQWYWDVDGDGITDAVQQNPIWIYEEAGQYSVSLQVENETTSEIASVTATDYVRVFSGESAISFEHEGDHTTIPPTDILNSSATVTLEAWIRPEGWGVNETALPRILDKSSIYLYLQKSQIGSTNEQSLVIALKDENNKKSRWNTPALSIRLGEWQHVALVINVQDQVNPVRLYLNGMPQLLAVTGELTGAIKDNSSAEFIIGNSPSGSSTFQGAIDDVRYWTRARSEAEIQQLMLRNLEGSEWGLVGYWNMDEGSGEGVNDLTSHTNHGLVDASWIAGVALEEAILHSEGEFEFPGVLSVHKNYPNPFRKETVISFSLSNRARVSVKVYSLLGRLTSTLMDDHVLDRGSHGIRFKAEHLSAGLYFYRISTQAADGTIHQVSEPFVVVN